MDIFDDGADLVLEFSGGLDFTGLTAQGFGVIATTNPQAEILASVSGSPFQSSRVLSGVGPTAFYIGDITGSTFASANSSTDGLSFTRSGDTFGFNVVDGLGGQITLSSGYVAGSALSGSVVFQNASIEGQNLIEGTHVFTLPNDIITVNIGDVATVPLPAAAPLLLGGIIGLILLGRRRRAPSDWRQ